MRYVGTFARSSGAPFAWIEIELLVDGGSPVLRRAGTLTPYLVEEIIDDATRCGRRSRVSVVVAEDASDKAMQAVRAALAPATRHGGVVVVSRGRALFASAVPTASPVLPLPVVLEFATRIGALLGALEEERGVSELMVASRGVKMRTELPQLQATTDVAIDGLARLLDARAQALPEATIVVTREVIAHLAGRAAIRSAVAGLRIEPQAAFEYYSAAVRSLLDAAACIANATPNSEASGLTKAFLALLRVRESLAVERGQLALALESSLPWQAARAALHSLIDAQALLLDAFAASASPEAIQALRRRSADPVFAEVARLEQRVLGGESDGLDAHTWFRAATKKLERLREVEAVQLAALRGTGPMGAVLH